MPAGPPIAAGLAGPDEDGVWTLGAEFVELVEAVCVAESPPPLQPTKLTNQALTKTRKLTRRMDHLKKQNGVFNRTFRD